MVRFVDDHEIERSALTMPTTERINGYKRQLHPHSMGFDRPHVTQGRRRNNEGSRKLLRNGERDESLSHSDLVGENRTAKFVHRLAKSSNGHSLMRMKRYSAEMNRVASIMLLAEELSGYEIL